MHGILAAIAIVILIAGFLLLVRFAMFLFGPKPINALHPFKKTAPLPTLDTEPN